VEGRKFQDIVLTPQDVSNMDKKIINKYVFTGQDNIKRIRTDEKGLCSAYKLGRCVINDFKPTICRCFPLYLDAFVGLCAFKNCSSVKKSYTIEDYLDELEHLLNMYEFWISYYRCFIDKNKN